MKTEIKSPVALFINGKYYDVVDEFYFASKAEAEEEVANNPKSTEVVLCVTKHSSSREEEAPMAEDLDEFFWNMVKSKSKIFKKED